MRILTVVKHLGPGGTERVAQNYALGYHRSSQTHSAVLAYAGGGPRADILTDAGVPVFVGGQQDVGDDSLEQAMGWRPDVVHIHRVGLADPADAAVLTCLRASRPALRVMETNVFGKPDYSKNRSLIDLHLHLTPWSLWKWSQWVRGMSPQPVGTVVPYGVDTDAFSPLQPSERAATRAERGLPPDAVVFGRVGQPSRPKWSPVIFEAFARHARRAPDAHLVLVGLPDELRPAMDALPSDVRIRVQEWAFANGDEALRRIYGCFDVFLHAAHIGESFGMVFTEALLCGVPVISLSTPTHDNGQVFVVGHERGGLLVADAEAMAEAMETLSRSPTLRHTLATQGANHVRASYALDDVTDTLIRVAGALRETAGPKALRQTLSTDLGLPTRQETRTLLACAQNVSGGLSWRSRATMQVLHTPAIYRLWQRLRFGS